METSLVLRVVLLCVFHASLQMERRHTLPLTGILLLKTGNRRNRHFFMAFAA